MSLPEISRRCLSCGAAVRVGSRFCQQCGKPLAAPETRQVEETATPPTGQSAPPADERLTATNERAQQTNEWTPPLKEFAAFEQSPAVTVAPEQPAGPVEDAKRVEAEAPVVYAHAPREEPADGPADAAGESLDADAAGAEEAAADERRGRVARVREGTRTRVERMREEAIVVLEETPDDSGLRFVVAAAALFIVFLVLLFLSTTVLR